MRLIRLFVVVLLSCAGLFAASTPTVAAGSLFVRTEGFATKTGFRGVFTWETTAPARGLVRYGTSPTELTGIAQPLGAGLDTAGMAVAYFGADADVRDIGSTYYWQVEDEVTGEKSEIKTLRSENAYNAWDPVSQSYTINILVQLDSESAPQDVPHDLSLQDLAAGMNVFAERLFDATDGYVRLGKVLVTDTNLDYPVNPPFLPAACFLEHSSLADVLAQTTVPFDSHTFGGWSIDDACTGFYIGRLGQLIIPWEDDLHLGYVSTHEMAHYALNAPDLYDPANISQPAPIANDGKPWCKNADWDGSLMHNTGGWTGGRWELTEFDRNAALTPCDHEGKPYTWPTMRERYSSIPADAENVIEHMVDTRARGNEDGGALDIMILDRAAASSSLDTYIPNDGEDVRCGPQDPQIVDPRGDANEVALTSTPLPSDPAFDVDRGWITASSSTGSPDLTFHISVPGLSPTASGAGEHFRFYFSHAGVAYQAWARRTPLATTFGVQKADNTAIVGAVATGSFDTANRQVRITVPSQPAFAWAPGQSVSGLSVLAQRYTGAVTLTADTATGQCGYLVAQERASNEAPTATDDAATTRMKTPVTIDVLANDTDPDGDALRVDSISSPGAGTATLASSGQVTYTPKAGFKGTDRFTYVVSDGQGGTDTAVVVVTVSNRKL